MAITTRTSEQVEKLLAEVFENKTSGAETFLNSFSYLRMYAIDELKGKFTEQELYALVDMRNRSVFEEMFAVNKEALKIELLDTIKFNQFSQPWKFNREKLLEKIDSLTSAQVYFLLLEINRFWNKESKKENSLNAFAKKFI